LWGGGLSQDEKRLGLQRVTEGLGGEIWTKKIRKPDVNKENGLRGGKNKGGGGGGGAKKGISTRETKRTGKGVWEKGWWKKNDFTNGEGFGGETWGKKGLLCEWGP